MITQTSSAQLTAEVIEHGVNLSPDMNRTHQGSIIYHEGVYYSVESYVALDGVVGWCVLSIDNNYYFIPEEEVSFSIPKLGYFNHVTRNEREAIELQLNLTRDWRYGLHPRRVSTRNLSPLLRLVMDYNVFNPSYPSFQEAMNMLETRFSVALSQDFLLAHNPFKDKCLVLKYRGSPCAVKIEEEVTILRQFSWLEDSIMEVLGND